MKLPWCFLAAAALLAVAGCGEPASESESDLDARQDQPPAAGPEPDHVLVDHILVGVRHPRLPGVLRTPADARKLAYDIVDRLEAGGDWDALKREYSNDRTPGRGPNGPYGMCNRGVAPRGEEYARGDMAPAFGDVGFALEVGEIGVADHDPSTSPFGFHIIKRIR